jgi:ABC-2 type transport system ATP-binding protein
MILSTHILPEVSTLCDRVIIINQGRVLVDDSLANLERQGAENERLQLEVRGDADRVLELLQAVPGVVDVTHLNAEAEPGEFNRFVVAGEAGSDHREVLANTLIGRGFGLLELKTAIPTLEEIFVKVITNDPIVSDDEDELALSDEEMDDRDEGDETEDRPARAKNKDENLDDIDDMDDVEDEDAEEAEVKPLKATPAFLQSSDDDLDEPRPDNHRKKKK